MASNKDQYDIEQAHSATKEFPEILDHFNIRNVKIGALIVGILIICCRAISILHYGQNTCETVLKYGSFKEDYQWQPTGCMMHHYSISEVRQCFSYISYWGGHNSIALVGDSRMRDLFYSMAKLVEIDPVFPSKAHNDLNLTKSKLNLQLNFHWAPLVNQSFSNILERWLDDEAAMRPKFILMTSGSWSIKLSNGSDAAFDSFQSNLTLLIPILNELSESSTLIWMLQEPVDESKLHPVRKSITNERIQSYNQAAENVLAPSKVKIWRTNYAIGHMLSGESQDGLHLGPKALSVNTQLFFNYYCNEEMNFADGSCCASADPASVLQIIAGAFLAFCSTITVLIAFCRRYCRQSITSSPVVSRAVNGTHDAAAENDSCFTVLACISRLSVVLAYVYLCDRTRFFMQENKHFTLVKFWLPVAYVAVLGAFFTTRASQSHVLSRLQTNEWKGWMQLVLLIYHMAGASQHVTIYMLMRAIVSGYLVLTGYGHFMFYFQRGDFGIVRLFRVLFRLNFLVIVLCFLMNRPYQFYYFVPLVTFWYLVIYIIMLIPPRVTEESVQAKPAQYMVLVIKLIAAVAVVSLMSMSQLLFEKIFLTRPWKALFVTSDDSVHSWWFRWQLDRYSVIYGMALAIGHHVLKRTQLLNEFDGQNLLPRGMTMIASVTALCGAIGYGVFAWLCRSKLDCNEVHSYVLIIPVVSYIALRNIFGVVRSYYSPFFSWFGTISLELFILQYHMWLTADTNGFLLLISQPINPFLVAFLFICVSHEAHLITETLTPLAVPNDPKLILRNLVCFAILITPLGFKYGYL